MKSFQQLKEESEARHARQRAESEARREEETSSAMAELLPEFTEAQAAAILRAIEVMR